MPSFTYNCIEKIIRVARIKKYYELSPAEILKVYEKKFKNQKSEPIKSVTKTLNVEKEKISSQTCYKISSRIDGTKHDNTKKKTKAVLFVHGGGYIMEINNLHWNAIKRIVQEKQAVVYIPIYPLAPNSDWKPTFTMLKELYLLMLKSYDPKDIIMIGDSAGAQIVLSFCQQCLEEQMPQPAKMILLSPPIDYAPDERTMQRYKELDQVDPMIATELYHL